MDLYFNGDCNFLFQTDYRRDPSVAGRYTAQVIDDYVDRLADAGVDAYLINANGQVPWYPSRRLDHVLTGYRRDDADHVRGYFPPLGDDFTQAQLDAAIARQLTMLNRFLDLAEAGVDWLAHSAAACRRRGVSPFVTVRMNDAHGSNNWEQAYFNCPPQRDPRCRLPGRHLDPRRGDHPAAALCNYQHQSVRDYYMTMLRELVEDYDFDGVELDWLRAPYCCPPPADQAAIDMMIDWIGQVRRLTAGKTLGLRVPARLGELRTIGLDVQAIARQGLVDYVAPSNFFQTTWDVDYQHLRRALGERVRLLGVIDAVPNWLYVLRSEDGRIGYRRLPTSDALMRGNAAGKLAMGVDGIEMFNFFVVDTCTDTARGPRGVARYRTLAELTDPEALRGKVKQYTLATNFNLWSPRFFERADQLPVVIEDGQCVRFEIAMGAEPTGVGLELAAQIVIERTDPLPRLGLSINGSWPSFDATATDRMLEPIDAYDAHVPEHVALEYRLPIGAIVDGLNELRVFDSDDARLPLPGKSRRITRVLSIDLAVRGGKDRSTG